MTILDRIANRFGYVKPAPARRRSPVPSGSSRSYAAASVNRLTADFTVSNISPDSELVNDLRIMRARSRKLSKDNDYMRRYVRLIKKNVVGPDGVSLTVVSDRGNEGAAKMIENDFYDWCHEDTAGVTRSMSFVTLCQLIEETRAVDGECFIRIVRPFGNDFGFALQLIPTDCLDENHNEDLGGGKMIRLGVEKDEWGAPVAYHIRKRNPVDWMSGGENWGRRDRIPASEIIHHFHPAAIGQSRGVPDMFSAILRLNMLGGYEESELVASRIGAGKMGFFTLPDGATWEGDDVDAMGHTITDAEPGSFEQLPPGAKVETFDPQHPNASFGAFMKAMLQGVACAADVSYHTITGDLSSVNYSSARIGLLDERDTYRVLQNKLVEKVCDRVFVVFREEKMLRSGLPPAEIAAMRPIWRPRRWTWVDPQKELNAAETGVRLGVTSRKQIIEEAGGDSEVVWKDLKDETERLKADGLLQEVQPAKKAEDTTTPAE